MIGFASQLALVSAAHHTEAVLPNGAIELMINFGAHQEVVAYGDRLAADAR